jgi:hypothetical protein
VTLAHRLLKNTVGTQWGHRDYVLLTQQWANDVDLDVAALHGQRHAEAYEHIGTVSYVVLNLTSTVGAGALLQPRGTSDAATTCTYIGPDGDAGAHQQPVVFRGRL